MPRSTRRSRQAAELEEEPAVEEELPAHLCHPNGDQAVSFVADQEIGGDDRFSIAVRINNGTCCFSVKLDKTKITFEQLRSVIAISCGYPSEEGSRFKLTSGGVMGKGDPIESGDFTLELLEQLTTTRLDLGP